MEFLGELMVELLLFYPGAFIRWGVNGFKPGKFSYYAKEATHYNVFTTILFIGIIVACVQIFKALL